MYVETEARSGAASQASAFAAFEVAALACIGHFSPQPRLSSPLLRTRPISGSVPRLCPEAPPLSTAEFWDRLKSPLPGRRASGPRESLLRLGHGQARDSLLRLGRIGSLGNLSLRSSSRERPALSVCTAPGERRRQEERAAARENTVMIRCQRMTEDRRCEEVEIAVPVSVYNNMESSRAGRRAGERRALQEKPLAARLKTWLIRV
jgi:hypothetical protein